MGLYALLNKGCQLAYDKKTDYVPIVSTVVNLTNLFVKCVILPMSKAESINRSHYFTHVQDKSYIRCLTLLIPILGNIVVALYDWHANRKIDSSSTSQTINRATELPPSEAEIAVERRRLESPRERALTFVRRGGESLRYITEYQDDDFVVLEAVSANGLALEFASDRLKSDREIIQAAIENNPRAAIFAIFEDQFEEQEIPFQPENRDGDNLQRNREIIAEQDIAAIEAIKVDVTNLLAGLAKKVLEIKKNPDMATKTLEYRDVLSQVESLVRAKDFTTLLPKEDQKNLINEFVSVFQESLGNSADRDFFIAMSEALEGSDDEQINAAFSSLSNPSKTMLAKELGFNANILLEPSPPFTKWKARNGTYDREKSLLVLKNIQSLFELIGRAGALITPS